MSREMGFNEFDTTTSEFSWPCAGYQGQIDMRVFISSHVYLSYSGYVFSVEWLVGWAFILRLMCLDISSVDSIRMSIRISCIELLICDTDDLFIYLLRLLLKLNIRRLICRPSHQPCVTALVLHVYTWR